jgi:hypothetical protein
MKANLCFTSRHQPGTQLVFARSSYHSAQVTFAGNQARKAALAGNGLCMGLRSPRPWNDAEFQALLAWLHPDPSQSGAAYAKIHKRLRLFFEGWRDAARHAEELADAAIDRAIRKLAEDPHLTSREPYGYIRTIAGYILKEYRSQTKSLALTIDPPDLRSSTEDEGLEPLRCLNLCLGRLSRDDYELVMSYYADDSAGQTAKLRQEVLPRKLAKSYGAIRVQVLRIRRGMEDCIQNCLTGTQTVTFGDPELTNIDRKGQR